MGEDISPPEQQTMPVSDSEPWLRRPSSTFGLSSAARCHAFLSGRRPFSASLRKKIPRSLRGQPDEYRRFLLDFIVEGTLPPLNGEDYMRKWSKPFSVQRLKTMVDSITHFGRNAQSRTQQDLSLAISQWHDDLQYLKHYHRQIPVPDATKPERKFTL